jgi:Leucine-rich repeat (LRR) protein
VNDDLFELLDSLPHLERLAFGGNKMSGSALPLLKSYPALKELSLSGQQRTDSGLWSVAVTDFSLTHLAALTSLEALDLGDTSVTDRGLAEVAKLRKLHTLDLRGTRVTSRGLAHLAGLPNLQRLRLWKARGIDDSAVPMLLSMTRLTVLEVPETSLTAAGLRLLAQHQALRQLFLGGLDITPEQLEALRTAMPNCHISWWQKPAIEYPDTGRRFGN